MKQIKLKYYSFLVVISLGILAFWGAVIYVGIHFICKFW